MERETNLLRCGNILEGDGEVVQLIRIPYCVGMRMCVQIPTIDV